jgi:hypothetical protein
MLFLALTLIERVWYIKKDIESGMRPKIDDKIKLIANEDAASPEATATAKLINDVQIPTIEEIMNGVQY